jgi:hypothetical protein
MIKSLIALLFSLTWMTSAMAVDVPSNLIVNAGGMQWAWASPCAPAAPSCGNPLVMHDGWNVASSSDFASSFTGFADLSAQFGAGTICASAYFNSGYGHCDDANVNPSYDNVRVWNAPVAWGPNSMDSASETFVVRAVPEPETYALMLAGLALVGFVARRRQRA